MMKINDLFNECMYYNGVEEKTVLGAALHMFSPVSMDAAEKIYRELTDNDIHEDYAKQLEEGLTVPYSFAPAHVNRQSASAVGTLGMKYFAEGKTETAREHQPDYLRLSQAERERAEKEKAEK